MSARLQRVMTAGITILSSKDGDTAELLGGADVGACYSACVKFLEL
jgi:hypothetical protein